MAFSTYYLSNVYIFRVHRKNKEDHQYETAYFFGMWNEDNIPITGEDAGHTVAARHRKLSLLRYEFNMHVGTGFGYYESARNPFPLTGDTIPLKRYFIRYD